MITQSSVGASSQKPASTLTNLLTAKEAAVYLKASESFLAKARMRGDGPPFIKVGRSIRYTEAAPAAVDEVAPAALDERAVRAEKMPSASRMKINLHHTTIHQEELR